MTRFSKTLALVPHPLTPCVTVRGVEVNVSLVRRVLNLTYQMHSHANALSIPDYEEPVRADGLWRETCCEAFLRAMGQAGYYEVNLSPSTQWAVYRFTEYRDGMRPVDIGAAPVIDREEAVDGLVLRASVDLSMLPQEFAAADWQLGLSCVIRGADGMTSYWALNHPPEKPDFHHDDCFALNIGAAERA